MAIMDSPGGAIWGELQLRPGEPQRVQIGPLLLNLQRLPGEWRIAREQVDTSEDGVGSPELGIEPEDLLKHEGMERFAVSTDDNAVSVLPVLADRPVVARPEYPFHLPAGEEVTVFVSTPLWARILVGEPPKKLVEVPVSRPSDTWFGPSTREGEVCYASRTFLRLTLDNVPIRPHRAITTLQLRNQAHDDLFLKALKLPVHHLALYAAPGGRIWTQDVTMERSGKGSMGALKLRDRTPRLAPDAVHLSDPRQDPEGKILLRAFSALFK